MILLCEKGAKSAVSLPPPHFQVMKQKWKLCVCVFVCLVNIQRSDDIDSSLSASELVCTPVYPGSESIWPNEKAPHSHTNTLNPLDSSVSLRDGLCSHGGALLLPGGQVGRSQGIMLKIFPPAQRSRSFQTEEEIWREEWDNMKTGWRWSREVRSKWVDLGRKI